MQISHLLQNFGGKRKKKMQASYTLIAFDHHKLNDLKFSEFGDQYKPHAYY